MNGKTAFVLLSGVLSGSLCACVQPPEAAAPAAPAPPPVAAAAPAPAPAPVAEPTPGDRWVSIRGATSVGEGCRRWRGTGSSNPSPSSGESLRTRLSGTEPIEDGGWRSSMRY